MHSEPVVFTYMVTLDRRRIEPSAYDESGHNPPQTVHESLCWLLLKHLVVQVREFLTL